MQPLDSTTQNPHLDACRCIRPAESVLERLLVHWRIRRERRATIKEMQALPDRLLQDAGIARSDIWRVADEAARKLHKL